LSLKRDLEVSVYKRAMNAKLQIIIVTTEMGSFPFEGFIAAD
jgi:hypothetical protein